MPKDLAEWKRGVDDAKAMRLPSSAMTRDYYSGYQYACALDYEYMGSAWTTMQTGQLHESPEASQDLVALAGAVGAGDAALQPAAATARRPRVSITRFSKCALGL